MWWARVREGTNYGRWVPTGTQDIDSARDYIALYYDCRVIEWLMM